MKWSTLKRDGIVSPRMCLIALLVNLLVFPPWMFADQMTWNGGTGAYNEANWSCNNCDPNDTATYPANGQTFNGTSYNYNVSIQSGGGNNAAVTLDSLEQGLDAVTVDSMSIRGGHVASTASLTVQNGNGSQAGLTIGNPANTQGNVLNIGNRGSLNVTGSNMVTLELSGGGGSLQPGAPNSVGAYIGNGGSVNVSDFSVLQLQNTAGGTRTLTNNGTINIGADGAPAALLLLSQGAQANFMLGGNGSVTMGGNAYIIGESGPESLTTGSGQTIIGAGVVELNSLTNNGTLTAASQGDGNSNALIIASPLTNFNSVTGKLTNGSYNAQDGAVLQLVGVGNSISSLNLANVQLTGSGIVGNANYASEVEGAGQGTNLHTNSLSGPDALNGLTHVTDATVDLQGVTATYTPANSSNTLTLRSDPLGIPTNLTVEQDQNGNGSNVTIAGNVKNVSAAYGAPGQSPNQTFGAVNGNPGTTIALGGSSINVSGSTLTIANNLSNQSYGTSFESASPSLQSAYSSINVVNGGTLNVGGNLTTHTNTFGDSLIDIDGYDNNGNLTGGAINVTGNLRNGGGFGSPRSNGNDLIELGNGNLTVGGNFTNNTSNGFAGVYLDGNSTVNVTGWFGQSQGNGGGESVLDIAGGHMTVGNLRNSISTFAPGTPYFEPQSSIGITNGGSLTVNGTFANIDSNGVLTGGAYIIGGPSVGIIPNGPTGPSAPTGPIAASTLNYNGANITAIGANTSLTLDDSNYTGFQGQILNNGKDAISGSLNEVTGSLGLYDGASLNLTSGQGLTIDSSGQVTLQGNGSLTATSLQNNGTLNLVYQQNSVNAGTLGNLTGGVLSGGTWNLSGAVNFTGGADGSQTITQLNNTNVSLGPSGGFFNNGDALEGLTSIVNGTQLGINGQTRSFGPLNVDGTTNVSEVDLNQGSSVTFNGPTGSSGVGLSMTNNAVMNVNGSTATLNLGGGNTASVASGSTLSINDGSTLALTNGTSNSPGVVTLDGGTINIQGQQTAGVLSVSDGGTYQINNGANSGNVTLSGLGQINVSSGNLAINANLTNWGTDPSNGLGSLSGGAYIVGNGSTLQLSSIGAGNSIQELNDGAVVSVTGNGLLTGDGTTNALAGLTEIDSGSTLSLRNAGNVTITPGADGPGVNKVFLNNFTNPGANPTLNLRDGTHLQINGDLEIYGGNLNITNGSSLNVGDPFGFVNIEGNGVLGGGPMNVLIGSGSTLSYTGFDITQIAETLTLGNREGLGTGTIQNLADSNPGHDALSYSLNAVSGTLNLQDGATLTLQSAAGSFTNQGNVTITNGSTFDVSKLGSNFLDVDGNGNLGGNYFIGSNSVLNYSGANVANINGYLTLDNSNGGTTGMITNGTGNDALSGSLNSVGFGGTLNLQNGAGLSLTGAQTFFTNGGQVNITNGSTFDVSGVGAYTTTTDPTTLVTTTTGFLDIDNNGNQNGSYLIGSRSVLKYSGADITAIAGNLTLDNSNGTGTGGITNANGGSHDALSSTLATVSGNLTLQNGANLELSNSSGVLNSGGTINVDVSGNGGSTLTVDNKLTNYQGSINVGYYSGGSAAQSQLNATGGLSNKSDDNNSDLYGNASVNVVGSQLLVGAINQKTGAVSQTSNLFNGAFTPNGGQATSTISLDEEAGGLVTGNVKNLALFGSFNGGGASANIYVTDGSNLTVDGNVKNIAAKGQTDGSGYYASMASINLLNGGGLNVNGTYTNYSGAFTGSAGLYLANNSTAVVTGLFTNSGGSVVDLDDANQNDGFPVSGSTLTANSGFKNYNSNVLLNNSSTLNVTGGFQNLSDDSNNSQGVGYSLLQIGSQDIEPSLLSSGSQGTVQTNHSDGFGFGPSVATITGGLVNSASTSNSSIGGGSAESKVVVYNGSTLNVDNLTNTAMAATPGGQDSAEAKLVLAGGNLNVTGNLINSTSVPVFQSGGSNGQASAKILSWDGSITVGGSFTNTNAKVYLNDTYLNAYNGILNSSTDSNFNPNAPNSLSGFSHMTFDGESEAYVNGGVTNSAVSISGGLTAATFKLDGGTTMTVSLPGSDAGSGLYAFTNMASTVGIPGPSGPIVGSAYAKTTITGGSSLTVNGNLLNMSSGNQTGAFINVECASNLTVNGTFNNTAGTLNVKGGSTANVMGTFTNDSNSSVNLSGGGSVQEATQSQQSGVTTSSQSATTTLNVTGEFDNAGNVSIGNGTALNVLEDSNSDPSTYSQTGGTTTLAVGGTLSADNVNITGGSVNGLNDGSGATSATIYGNVTVGDTDLTDQNSATLNLGDPMSLDVVGTYDQTALGILDLSLDGVGDNGSFTGSLDDNNSYDQIDVAGNVMALDGTLNLNLEDGFYSTVVQGDYFNVLNWTGTDGSGDACVGSADTGCFGTFNDVTFTDSLGNLDTFVEQVNSGDGGTELDLVVVGTSGAPATPEPGTLSMLFCAMLIGGGVTWYRRKRANVAE